MDAGFTDAHVHYWNPARLSYPWLAEVPALAGFHGPAELRAEAGDALPRRIVFVQADCAPVQGLAEVEWIESLAAETPAVAGMVAFAPMNEGHHTMRHLNQLAARPLVRGVRHLIQGEADPMFCCSDAFVAGVQACGERGLSFDLCVKPHQLAAVARLVERCPHTPFILDHGGKPDLATPALEQWRTDLAEVARHPHVACKVSGLVTEAGPGAATAERIAPAVDHLLECFGPSRLLFGSDWPVVKLACPYQAWHKMAKMLLARLAADQQAAIFNDNASRLYRLG